MQEVSEALAGLVGAKAGGTPWKGGDGVPPPAKRRGGIRAGGMYLQMGRLVDLGVMGRMVEGSKESKETTTEGCIQPMYSYVSALCDGMKCNASSTRT